MLKEFFCNMVDVLWIAWFVIEQTGVLMWRATASWVKNRCTCEERSGILFSNPGCPRAREEEMVSQRKCPICSGTLIYHHCSYCGYDAAHLVRIPQQTSGKGI